MVFDPFGRAEEIRGGVVGSGREVLAVAAIEQHGGDSGGRPGLDVAPSVADDHARSIEVESEDQRGLMEHPGQRLPARAAVEVVMDAGEREIEPEVLGDVLVVDLDSAGIDRSPCNIGLVGHHHQCVSKSSQLIARLRGSVREHNPSVARNGGAVEDVSLDQRAVAVEEGGGTGQHHVVSRPSSSSATIDFIERTSASSHV
jgi:hypothetical protein